MYAIDTKNIKRESKHLFKKLKKTTPTVSEKEQVKMREEYIQKTRSQISTLCGRIGGLLRAQSYTKEQRQESARHAANARWNKHKKIGV